MAAMASEFAYGKCLAFSTLFFPLFVGKEEEKAKDFV